MAVAACEHEPELPVELDLDRFLHGPTAERRPRARDPRPAAQRPACGGRVPAAVRGPDNIWVEHRNEALELALADRLRERSHGAIVLLARGRGARALTLDV